MSEPCTLVLCRRILAAPLSLAGFPLLNGRPKPPAPRIIAHPPDRPKADRAKGRRPGNGWGIFGRAAKSRVAVANRALQTRNIQVAGEEQAPPYPRLAPVPAVYPVAPVPYPLLHAGYANPALDSKAFAYGLVRAKVVRDHRLCPVTAYETTEPLHESVRIALDQRFQPQNLARFSVLDYADDRAMISASVPWERVREVGGLSDVVDVSLDSPYEALISTRRGERAEIPWDFARAFGDAACESQMDEAAALGRRKFASRLRDRRRAAGMSRREAVGG